MSRTPQILFPVAVTPEALQKFDQPEHKQTHRTAASLVMQHGILLLGAGDEQDLLDAIGKLTGGPNKAWSNLIPALKACHRVDDQTLSQPVATFLASPNRKDSAERIRLALVDSRTGGVSARLNATERVTLPNTEVSGAVSEAQAIGTFPVGTQRTQIAEQFITPLARLSQQVKIMDPHLLQPLVEDPSSRPDHIRWLLEALGEALPDRAEIWLIGKLQSDWAPARRPNDEARIKQFVRDSLVGRKAPLTVEVRLAQALSQPLKNRYVWFDCTDPFDVLHNFVPLEHDRLREEFRIIRQGRANHKETERLADAYDKAGPTATVTATVRIA